MADPLDDEATALARPRRVAGRAVRYELRIVEGPDVGRSVALDAQDPGPVRIGQSPACEVRLADKTVSRRHAAVDVNEERLRLVDLGSTNGTFVNGVQVVEAILHVSDIVRVGATALRVDGGTSTSVETPARAGFGRVVGESLEMRRLYPLCDRLAASDVTVIIEGETGTGKEVLAESIHDMSARSKGPFVVFDCTAVPSNLVESELFGHERGAFTGAIATRKGVFEQASGGTLLIDEIGDLDYALQPKLLRALQRAEVRRVGGDRSISVDVRVLCATRRDLDREVQDGRFRDDLFFRLAVARITLPPLRERRGDIRVLATHFWRQLGGGGGSIPYELIQRFERAAWPGNVRELANAVARHLALGELDVAAAAPGAVAVSREPIDAVLGLPFRVARDRLIQEFERRYVASLLALHDGNVAQAASASGLARRYFNIIRARNR